MAPRRPWQEYNSLLLIYLRTEGVDADHARQLPGMQPGEYVHLRIRDSGKVMDEAALQHVFEFFYTSKFTGRGLGMAAK